MSFRKDQSDQPDEEHDQITPEEWAKAKAKLPGKVEPNDVVRRMEILIDPEAEHEDE